jgi:hypothetical protein
MTFRSGPDASGDATPAEPASGLPRRTGGLAVDGDLAKAEPETLRYRIPHATVRFVRSGVAAMAEIAASWP